MAQIKGSWSDQLPFCCAFSVLLPPRSLGPGQEEVGQQRDKAHGQGRQARQVDGRGARQRDEGPHSRDDERGAEAAHNFRHTRRPRASQDGYECCHRDYQRYPFHYSKSCTKLHGHASDRDNNRYEREKA